VSGTWRSLRLGGATVKLGISNMWPSSDLTLLSARRDSEARSLSLAVLLSVLAMFNVVCFPLNPCRISIWCSDIVFFGRYPATEWVSLSFLPQHASYLSSVVPAPTWWLHVCAEAAPSTIYHLTNDSQRITMPSSADVSGSLAQYLDETFAPLEFPPALAQHILTHLSHCNSVIGHNLHFAFLGVFKMIGPTSSQFPLIICCFCCRTASTQGLPLTLPARAHSSHRTRPLPDSVINRDPKHRSVHGVWLTHDYN